MLSIVIPVFNEEESIGPLVDAVSDAMRDWRDDWELVLVDDGSTDSTAVQVERAAGRQARVKLVQLARNYGQSAAMQAGFDSARGSVIVTMDGDLQNDPADIRSLCEKLEQGYDLVSGYRVGRQDHWLTRKLPSRIANAIIRIATGLPIRDTGCTLKAFRSELLENMRLYADLHRFIPALAASVAGARITEVPVRHHARRFGRSKYGLSRVGRVLADLLKLSMLRRFEESPLRMFAAGSVIAFALGLGAVVAAMAMAVGMREEGSTVVLVVIASCWLALAGFLMMAGLIAENFVHADAEEERFSPKLLRAVTR